jgi:hypothetical protein
MKNLLVFMKKNKFEIFLFSVLFIFSLLLFWKTFRADSEGNILIATKVWSDFSATIPLIRSFSLGSNFPPEYPIFAGPPIKYHFVFFALVGLIEKVGVPLTVALNGLSIVGFLLLLILIYVLAKTVFEKKAVGFLAIILFLFNGSFSFLEFLKTNPISLKIIPAIIQNRTFPSFGPYDGKTISAFWNLNIYTNQRHLALAYAAFLFLIYSIYISAQKPKELTFGKTLLLGLFVGLFPFVHFPVFGMMGITLILCIVLFPKIGKKIILSGLVAIIIATPQILYMYLQPQEGAGINFRPGYLIENLNFASFTSYWFLNLGLVLILAPLGFLLAKRGQRKIFLPFLLLFIFGNLFQFSVEIAANHKFFNLTLIGMNMFTAYLIYQIWIRNKLAKVLSLFILVPLTLSGVIDIFPIFNDYHMKIPDMPKNKTVNFIHTNTPKDAVFLNATFLYDPASLAGRKIFLGWPYFAWSAGYETSQRHEVIRSIVASSDKTNACLRLFNENIDYVEIQNPTQLEDVSINYSFFDENFIRIYFDEERTISIYDVHLSCN